MRHSRTPITIHRAFTIATLALLAACSDSDDERAQHSVCERMRDHLVELRLATVGHDREAHREVMRRAVGTDVVEACERSMSDDQVTCVLNAYDAAAAAACMPAAE